MTATCAADSINFLQPSGFRVVLDRTRFPKFTFFAQRVSHPSLSTPAAEIRARQYSSVPQIGDTLTYGPLTMNVIVDENLESYLELKNWMTNNISEIVDPDGEEPSKVDLVLSILDSKNNVIKEIKYRDSFPTSIGEIDMEANVDNVQVVTFPVEFRYTYFDM